MNGQSHLFSDSGNGTRTPSSTSYPASLSSQSSRDCSPARPPPHFNHGTPQKTANPVDNFNIYKYDTYNSNSGYYPDKRAVTQGENKPTVQGDMNRGQEEWRQGYQPTGVQQGYQPTGVQQGYQPAGVQQGYQPPVQPLPQQYRPYQQQLHQPEPPPPSYSSSQLPPRPAYPYQQNDGGVPGGPGRGTQQTGYPGGLSSPTGLASPPGLPQAYQAGPPLARGYQAPLPRQQQQQFSEPDPISSGPPRTNALGIIPYSTEGKVSRDSERSQQTGGYPGQAYPNQGYPGVGGVVQSPSYPPTGVVSPHRQPPPLPLNNHVHQNNYTNAGPVNSAGYYPGPDDLANQMSHLSVTQYGYNKLWGRDAVDLLKTRDVLPERRVEPPPIRLTQDFYDSARCSPDIFRCTLTKIPETKSLLDKSRLPLGVLIHPFKDLNQLSVIQCTVIVRCRACRTYINPFVFFVDSKHWKCNLCFRVNDLPEEFQYDPLTKTYGDPSRRPEIKSATIEFIAPSEYMVRPPQPAAYVFVLDVSRLALETGYLSVFCETLLAQLDALPGDSRTSLAFITYDSTVHFYSLSEAASRPQQMVVIDINDIFIPCPENLLVNLNECLGLVRSLLSELPQTYRESYDTGTALGPALQAAYKLLAPTGGRVTVVTCALANSGPGNLSPREETSLRSGERLSSSHLSPSTDFYKKLALDCSSQQIAVDLFLLNSQFIDLPSLSGVSRFSGGCMYHVPLFNAKNRRQAEMFQRSLQRYLCRKIGFESVMRLRCTRGLSIHTFHGNFFVRSTDLLSLPNINPDAGFGMQVSIDENLTDVQNVSFQAALLYTSSKGERRIRVHTICLPIASNLSDVLHGADQQCIVGLLAKLAVDRCLESSLADAREAFVNVVADMLSAYKVTQSAASPASLIAPASLSLLPLYVLALLKYIGFRVGGSTRLDDRVFGMCQMKSLPLSQLIQAIYPDLYPIHNIAQLETMRLGGGGPDGQEEEEEVVQPPLLHLSAERIDSRGVYLMDDGNLIIIYVGRNIPVSLAISLFGAPSFNSIPNHMNDLPEVNSPESKRLRNFVNYLQNEKPVPPSIEIVKEDSPERQMFVERLVEDKTDFGCSYYEFLQRVKHLVK